MVLAVHAQSHLAHFDSDDVNILDSDVVSNDLNCEICSFYFDQQLFSNEIETTQCLHYFLTSYKEISQLEIATSFKQYYLRGPPQS